MTKKAKEFLAANKESPVVEGVAIGRGGEGCFYRLKDGRLFRLSRAECRQVGMPRWSLAA